MAQIKVSDLTFAYPGSYDNIFEHTSFQFDSDWKLGFIGRNGRGKTTFLKLFSLCGAASRIPGRRGVRGDRPRCAVLAARARDGSAWAG